jgi:dipeptidyl aminopeptidase/acylaminoacyl peptidase
VSLSSGDRLGPYEILSAIGAGGMGEVYRARDTRLGRIVAIKILPAGLAADGDRLARFEREARSASALNHPNIVTIHEVEEVGSTFFLVMELVEGITLREALAEGSLPLRKLLSLAAQIAEGLARAHASGIVHRDIKPENVMITNEGLVKILDFGLAKLALPEDSGEKTDAATVSAMTEPGVVMGTVGYMSPEQAIGKTVDFRSDQFSFGAMLYEMATGHRAFQRETAPETLSAILREEPEPVGSASPKTPAPLRWIIDRCLAKEPRERYASTEDLARDLAMLRDHLAEAAISVEMPSAPPAPRSRILPILAVPAFLAVLAAGLLAGNFLWRRSAAPSPPSFHRLTFRLGTVSVARFAPDGQTILYGAAWEGRAPEIFSTRLGSPESRPLGFGSADMRSVSSSGELAMLLRPRVAMGPVWSGTLARVPLAGGAPRETLEDVYDADWTPDGKDLAVVRAAGGKRRLEFPIGKPLYETSGWITQMRFSPSGDRIAFLESSGFGGSLAMLDRAGKKTTLVEKLFVPYGLAWSPRGDEIWFAEIEPGDSGKLVAVKPSGQQRLLARVAGGLGLSDLSPDGRALVTRYTWRTGILGLFPGATGERDLSWLDESDAADLSADGKTLLFTEMGRGVWPGTAVYLRKTDGSAAIRLGDGVGMGLSPDGKWALTVSPESPPRLILLPVGPGEVKALPNAGIESYPEAAWFPSGDRVLFAGIEKNHGVRCYVQDLDGSPPRPVTPEGTGLPARTHTVSPDGESFVAVGPDQGMFLYPTKGGEGPKRIPGLEPRDIPIRWSADGRSLYVFRYGELPAQIDRLAVETGVRKPWKKLAPSDPSGMAGVRWIEMTPDGESYVYSYSRFLSDLYLVEGLK